MQFFNTHLFNTGTSATESVADAASVSYSIRVFDISGNCLCYLQDWVNGKLTATLNQPASIEFEYPAFEEKAQYLTFPNQIWLYNQDDTVIQKFHIQPTTTIQNEDTATIHVVGESLLQQLAREFIVDYDTSGKNLFTVISDLLNLQTHPLPIYPGSIDYAVGSLSPVLRFEKITILEAVEQILDTVGVGTYWIIPGTRKFNWKLERGQDVGQQIRIRKNMKGIRVKKDFSKLVNRLYLFGNDNDTNGTVSLSQIAPYVPYIDDTGSIAQYGVVSGCKILKNIVNPYALQSYGQAFLQQFSQPYLSYEIDFANLHANNPIKYAFEWLGLGSRVWVINEDLGIESKEKIVRIETELDNPIRQRIVLGRDSIDLDKVFGGINERLATLEREEMVGYEDTKERLNEDGYLNEENLGDTITQMLSDSTSASTESLIEAFDNAVSSILEDTSSLTTQIVETIIENSIGSGGNFEDAVVDSIGNVLGNGLNPNHNELRNALSDELLGTEDTSPIVADATGNLAGTSSDFARADHTHLGMPWVAGEAMEDLTGTQAGILGYVESANQYWLNDGTGYNNQILTVSIVESLPEIPTQGFQLCFYQGQIWIAYESDTRWYPMYKPTTYSGLPEP